MHWILQPGCFRLRKKENVQANSLVWKRQLQASHFFLSFANIKPNKGPQNSPVHSHCPCPVTTNFTSNHKLVTSKGIWSQAQETIFYGVVTAFFLIPSKTYADLRGLLLLLNSASLIYLCRQKDLSQNFSVVAPQPIRRVWHWILCTLSSLRDALFAFLLSEDFKHWGRRKWRAG